MSELKCLGDDAPLALIDELSTNNYTIFNATGNPMMEISGFEFVDLNLDGLQPVIVEEIPQVCDETSYENLCQSASLPCQDDLDYTLHDMVGIIGATDNGDAQDILQLQDINVFGDIESGELGFSLKDADGMNSSVSSADGSDKESTEEESPATPPAPKRLRKRKQRSEDAPKSPPPKRRRRPLKTKMYDMEPFQDPELERKRQNALNAKKHREMQKKHREKLREELEAIKQDRDQLKEQLEKMMQREADLMVEIEILRQQKTADFIC